MLIVADIILFKEEKVRISTRLWFRCKIDKLIPLILLSIHNSK